MAWKIDLSKAYDKLSWDFIKNVLSELQIPTQLSKLIISCISTTSFQVLINGDLSETFSGNRGIRQGDPLSPYLFVMCMEKLSHLIQDGVETGKWKPVKSTRYGPYISHLFFADDLILFAEASSKQARFLKNTMDMFCKSSRQSVNFDKSAIYCSPNTCPDLAADISSICGSPLTQDLGKYLGMPILHSRVGKNTYANLVDKAHARLASWKSKVLNIAGRLTLIQSVTSAMPMYAMQTTKLPIDTCEKLDSINRNFLWGDTPDQKKIHLVNWNSVCKPKNLGGLGLKKTRNMNQAMLAKAGWRIAQHDQGLWSQMFRKKYLTNSSFPQNYKKPAACSNAWSSITYGSKALEKGIKWRIGDGSIVLFWMDTWTDFGALSNYAINSSTIDLTATVCDFWCNMEWNTGKLFEALPPHIVHHICTIPVSHSNSPDKIIWGPSANGKFLVKSAYLLNFPTPPNNFNLWRKIWKLAIPPKMKVFLWTIASNKLLTNDQRMIRHFTTDPSCFHCSGVPETLLHLFRNCPKAMLAWNSFHIPPTMAASFRLNWSDWFFANLMQEKSFHINIPWNVFFIFTCWHIWKWRCKCIFDVTFNLPFDMRNIIFSSIYESTSASKNIVKDLPKQNVQLNWIKPPDGYVKVNVDGSLDKWGKIGAGGILRDSTGAWISGFMISLGTGNTLQAEAWGIFYGMQLVARNGCQKVIFESDSASLIKLLNDNDGSLHPLDTVISNCKMLAASIQSCSFRHIYREENNAADFLAKASIGNELGIIWLEEAPPGMVNIIIDDLIGHAKTRSIPVETSHRSSPQHEEAGTILPRRTDNPIVTIDSNSGVHNHEILNEDGIDNLRLIHSLRRNESNDNCRLNAVIIEVAENLQITNALDVRLERTEATIGE